MDKLLQDLRFAVRSLRRQPGFVAVALATLALGIGTTTAMFTVVNGVLLKPLPFHDPGALRMIQIVGGDGMLYPLPDTDFLALRANHPAFERVGGLLRHLLQPDRVGHARGRARRLGLRRLLPHPRRAAAARAVLRAARRRAGGAGCGGAQSCLLGETVPGGPIDRRSDDPAE